MGLLDEYGDERCPDCGHHSGAEFGPCTCADEWAEWAEEWAEIDGDTPAQAAAARMAEIQGEAVAVLGCGCPACVAVLRGFGGAI